MVPLKAGTASKSLQPVALQFALISTGYGIGGCKLLSVFGGTSLTEVGQSDPIFERAGGHNDHAAVAQSAGKDRAKKERPILVKLSVDP